MESKMEQNDQFIQSIFGGNNFNIFGNQNGKSIIIKGRNNLNNRGKLKLIVRRESIIQDTLNQISAQNNLLKNKLKIKFAGEVGVDEGGVKKEFFQILMKELFDPIYAMFVKKEVRINR